MSLEKKALKPVHAGEILLKDFMKPNNITAYKLSKIIGLSQTHIGRIIKRKRPITLDAALRLARVFSTSPEFWLNIQNKYDLDNLSDEIKKEIEKIEPIKKENKKNADKSIKR